MNENNNSALKLTKEGHLEKGWEVSFSDGERGESCAGWRSLHETSVKESQIHDVITIRQRRD